MALLEAAKAGPTAGFSGPGGLERLAAALHLRPRSDKAVADEGSDPNRWSWGSSTGSSRLIPWVRRQRPWAGG